MCLFLGKQTEWDAETCRGERERENGVGCGMLGPAEESIMREKKKKFEGFTVDRESNEVKGELSWSCAIYMTMTHVNF